MARPGVSAAVGMEKEPEGLAMSVALRLLAVLLAAAIAITGCGDECREYSAHSCKQLEKATYNTWFRFPDGRDYYLGVAEGLGNCGDIARAFASSKHLYGNSDWSYICCLKTKDSECAEKHR